MYGIDVVSTCNEPTVDLVFVHGLRGDPIRTWTSFAKNTVPTKRFRALNISKVLAKRTTPRVGPSSAQPDGDQRELSVFWPKDYLSQDVPDARILSYGYDANVSTILNKSADRSIFSVAQDLVTRLETIRDSENTRNIPIIFIAHSLGGLVVKDALKFSQDQEGFQHHLHSVFTCTYGVIFFGTPHRGSELASLGKITANIAGLGMAASEQHLLRSLEQGSTELARIGDAFSRMLPQESKGLKVYSFQEGLPLTTITFAGKVVEEWSSVIGDAYEGKAVIQANHMEMCRFSNKDHPDYVMVSAVVRRWSREAQKGKWREYARRKELSETHVESESQKNLRMISPELSQLSLTATKRLPMHLPQAVTRHFLGRDVELDLIRNKFQNERMESAPQRIVVLHGMGGIGKTQLALAYAYRDCRSYSATFWINARSDQTIILGYVQLAQQLVDWAAEMRGSAVNFTRIAFELGLGQSVSPSTGEVKLSSTDSRVVVDAMKMWLAKPGNKEWLLIFDGIDDLEETDLQSFLPATLNGDILITSRRLQAAQLGAGIDVPALNKTDARDVLLKNSHTDSNEDNIEGLDTIAKSLGRLPLALAQAGSYMAATRTSPDTYLDLYQTRRKELLDRKPPKAIWQYGDSVLTTWEISFSSVEARSPATARLLLLCGHLHPDNIPYILFRYGVIVDGRRATVWQSLGHQSASKWKRKARIESLKRLFLPHHASVLTSLPWVDELLENELKFHESIQMLCDYSLISENERKDGLTIHPLVHSWCSLRHPQSRTDLIVDAAVLLGRAVDWDHTLPRAWEVLRELQPIMIDFASKTQSMDQTLFVDCKDNLNILHSLEAIASCLCDIEHYEEAKTVFEINYQLATITLGLKHPLPLATLDQLATSVGSAGYKVEAQRLRMKLTSLSREALGTSNADYWTYQHNLGLLLSNQDKFEEAQLVLEAVARYRRKNPNREDTIATNVNLGVVYLLQGQYERAEWVFRDAKDRLELLPDSNPETYMQVIGWLGYTMSESTSTRRAECEALLTTAIQKMESIYGREDPLVLRWLKNLLDFYREDLSNIDETRIAEMASIVEYLIQKWREVRSPTDRNIPIIQEAFATLWYLRGDFGKGKKLNEDALASLKWRRTIGGLVQDRSLKGDVLMNLGVLHWDRGLNSTAIDYWERAILCYEEDMPRGVADASFRQTILSIRGNIAIAWRDQNKLEAAETALKQINQAEGLIAGDEATILGRNNLATVYHLQGRHQESLDLFQAILSGIKPTAEQDSAKLLVQHNLACLHETMGNVEEAIRLLESTFNSKELQMGLRNPAAMKTALTLGRLYRHHERLQQAMELADKIRPFLEYA